MNWVIGHNMLGYLPESDPWVTDDWESARDALIWEIERHADDEIELGNNISEYDDAIDDLRHLQPIGEQWSWTIGNTSYWLNATDEEPKDDKS